MNKDAHEARAVDDNRPDRQNIHGVMVTKPNSREGRKTTILAGGSVFEALAMSSTGSTQLTAQEIASHAPVSLDKVVASIALLG